MCTLGDFHFQLAVIWTLDTICSNGIDRQDHNNYILPHKQYIIHVTVFVSNCEYAPFQNNCQSEHFLFHNQADLKKNLYVFSVCVTAYHNFFGTPLSML